jgi:hypothetical protein
VQRLPAQLIHHRFDDFRIAVADVEDAEAAQAVDVFAPGDVAICVRAGVGPFDDRFGFVGVARFAILEEAGIDVLAKRLDRFMRDPACLFGGDLRRFDQPQDALGVFVGVALSVVRNFLSPSRCFRAPIRRLR